MKEGRSMVTSKVVVMVVDTVTVERANNTNNKVIIDVGSNRDDDGKEALF